MKRALSSVYYGDPMVGHATSVRHKQTHRGSGTAFHLFRRAIDVLPSHFFRCQRMATVLQKFLPPGWGKWIE